MSVGGSVLELECFSRGSSVCATFLLELVERLVEPLETRNDEVVEVDASEKPADKVLSVRALTVVLV